MKQKNTTILGLGCFILGLVLTLIFRNPALSENATASNIMIFSLSLILTFLGVALLIFSPAPMQKPVKLKTMATAAMFAALCYIGFAVLRIDIPVGTEKTAFHLGNVFCVLGALFLGGFWGGMAGAIGLTIADLTSGYVTSAPKTFLLKLGIGLITGLIAHRVFHISKSEERKVPLPIATVLSCAAGMAFNVIADPTVGYFYKRFVLGVPQEIANIWAKMGAITTLVNAIIATVVASVLYLALRPALRRTNLMPRL